jgi:hypothetical protein
MRNVRIRMQLALPVPWQVGMRDCAGSVAAVLFAQSRLQPDPICGHCITFLLCLTGLHAQVMFCIVYAYAALGVALFGGLVSVKPSDPHYQTLVAMDYGSSGYWAINLNDMPSGMVLMFQMLVVNNWMVFAEAYGKVGGAPAWIFFITFYFIGVIAGALSLSHHAMIHRLGVYSRSTP